MKNKVTFTIDEVEYASVRPTQEEQKEAQLVYNSSFNSALKSGALLRKTLTKYMREQGLWDDDKDSEHKILVDIIKGKVRGIKNGGIKLKEGFELALEVRDARQRIGELLSDHTDLDLNTAEGQSEAARFNFLVSCATVDNKTGDKIYSGIEDYIDNASTELAIASAESLAALMFDMDSDYKSKLPENEFLTKYKFVDEKLRLINKDGHLVSRDGKLINELGFFVDKNGKLVDIEGNPVDEEGNWVYEDKPFLDDKSGKPIKIKKTEAAKELEEAVS